MFKKKAQNGGGGLERKRQRLVAPEDVWVLWQRSSRCKVDLLPR